MSETPLVASARRALAFLQSATLYDSGALAMRNELARAILAHVERADDSAATCDAMLSLCQLKAQHTGDFWNRLAGSIRKARAML